MGMTVPIILAEVAPLVTTVTLISPVFAQMGQLAIDVSASSSNVTQMYTRTNRFSPSLGILQRCKIMEALSPLTRKLFDPPLKKTLG